MNSDANVRGRRSRAGLVLGGLLAGLLTLTPTMPATAAGEGGILIYMGDGPVTYFTGSFGGYDAFGKAVGVDPDMPDKLPADLSGFACIVLPMNQIPFSPATLGALVAYVKGGGNVLAVADGAAFTSSIITMNGVAEAMGASMRLTRQSLDSSVHSTRRIQKTPLTEGVSTVSYAFTTGIDVFARGSARRIVRTDGGDRPGAVIVAAEAIGAGTFVQLGDSNILLTTKPSYPAGYDNGALARNLCVGSLVEHRVEGFFGPMDSGVVNRAKAGSTVPLQFRVFDKKGVELVDPAVVESFTTKRVACPAEPQAAEEADFTVPDNSVLRYTDGKFRQYWKTPTSPGCYMVTVTTTGGGSLSADFVLR